MKFLTERQRDWGGIFLAVVLWIMVCGVAALSGCAGPAWLDEPPRVNNTITRVHVIWLDSCELVTMRLRQHKPAHPSTCGYAITMDGDLCVIIAVRPKTWRDKFAAEVAGHELFHCAGATHPERT